MSNDISLRKVISAAHQITVRYEQGLGIMALCPFRLCPGGSVHGQDLCGVPGVVVAAAMLHAPRAGPGISRRPLVLREG